MNPNMEGRPCASGAADRNEAEMTKKGLSLILAILLIPASSWSQGLSLGKTSFAPGEAMETILRLGVSTRVSLRVSSSTGVALSLHDKMEGQIARDGAQDRVDGRLDLTLDRGDYKVKIEGGDPKGLPIGLSARLFSETNGEKPAAWPRLVPGQAVSANLKDLESASYWVELRKDEALEVEALGRDLALAEVWREGQYLVASYTPREERSVETGRPMAWICVSRRLEAGRYLVRLYGGAARSWPKEDLRHPLLLRSGFLRMPIGGRLDLTVSPFGRDFVLAEGYAGLVLSRKDRAEATLSALAYAPGRDRLAFDGASKLDKASPSLACALGLADSGPSLVAVGGKPGDRLLLEAGCSRYEFPLPPAELARGGLLMITEPYSSAPEIAPSGFSYRFVGSGRERRLLLVHDFCAPLSSSVSLRQGCNAGQGDNFSIYIRVDEAGSYRIAEKTGTGQAVATYRVERLEPTTMKGRGPTPALAADKSYLELAKGWYRLDIRAQSFGILDFLVYRDGFLRGVKEELAKDPPAPPKARTWVLGPDPAATELRVVLGGGPDLGTGLVWKPFPLALEDGLSLELAPQTELSLPLVSESPLRLRRLLRAGSLLLDGQEAVEGGLVRAGRHLLTLKAGKQEAAGFGFAAEADYEDLGQPQPTAFGQGLPRLQPGTTVWKDAGREETTTWAFEVRESAVYVLESVGRLSTTLALRTASRTKLFAAKENGYGRNASLRLWLRPGQYYLQMKTDGSSTGRMGVRMDRVPLAAQLSLDAGAVDRRSLAADTALRFAFTLGRDARISLNSVGLTATYPVRLEDAEGFIAYQGEGRTRLDLDKGSYLLYSLPLSLETSRLTWIDILDNPEAPPPVAGTRRLAPNTSLTALWKDGPENDRYSFALPADLDVYLAWPKDFEASLEGQGLKRPLDPSGSARLSLKRGSYVLALRPRETNTLLPYTVALGVDGLAPGIDASQAVEKRTSFIPVTAPEDGFYEIWSLGRNDIKARLVDAASGELLATSDDNGSDWNIDIVQRLRAGRYRLELSSIAGSESEVVLHMVSRNARTLGRASSSFEASLALDPSGVLLPFDTKAEEGLFLVKAEGGAPVSFRLYRGDLLVGAGDGLLAIPLRQATSYSLYAWSPFAASSTLSVKRLAERAASLSQPQALGAGEVLRLQNPDAVSARLVSGELQVSPGFELPCAAAGSTPFSTLAEGGWVWAPGSGAGIEPLTLGEGEGAVFALSPVDQGFFASSAEKVILVGADSRGQFRCGISALPAAQAGSPPYDWEASAAWSQGSVALLPPGSWKARVWDGQRGPGITRRSGVGVELYELKLLPALAAGRKESFLIPAGKAIAMDLPASTLSALLGEGIVLSAWKDGEALATSSGLDGRLTEVFGLPACRLFVANSGLAEASVRLSVLPARSQTETELSAAHPFEAVNLPAEGLRLRLKAAPGELLCLSGEGIEVELEAADGSYARFSHTAADGLFASLPVAPGAVRLRSRGGFVRAWLAKPGNELPGLLAQEGAAPARELKDAALLSGRGDAFRFSLTSPGYVDLSCPGPALLSLAGGGQERRTVLSGSRDDLHLFAWLPEGDYTLWQRPAQGSAAGGILRMDRIESSRVDPENAVQKAFIGAREYQAWSFTVSAAGLVGAGVKAESDGLQGFLYDSRQGLVAKGPLMYARLAAGDYLLVVKGLDAAPMEYSLILAGTEGSRLGVPAEVVEAYKNGKGGGASVAVPLRWHSARGGPTNRGEGGFQGGGAGGADGEGDAAYEEGQGGTEAGSDAEYEGDGEGEGGDETTNYDK
jgi:hypothetical protein